MAPLQLRRHLCLGLLPTCSPAAAWVTGIFQASSICRSSVPNTCRVDLLAIYFLFVLGETQSPFFTLITLHYYCLNHSVHLLALFLPVTLCLNHFPSLLPVWQGACQPSLLPFLPSSGPSPLASQGPAVPAGNLTQTRCGFLLLFLLFPLICQGLQRVEVGTRLSRTHILLFPLCFSVQLCSPHQKRTGEQCKTVHLFGAGTEGEGDAGQEPYPRA